MNHSITISSLISSIPARLPKISKKYIDEYNFRIDHIEKELGIDLFRFKITNADIDLKKTKYSMDREVFLIRANSLKQYMYSHHL